MTSRHENFGALADHPAETPWGPAQSWTHLADGIDSYSTASHGGIRLSGDALDRFYATFPTFRTFAGPRDWFEEDEDWSAVCILFPDAFLAQDIYHAVRTVSVSLHCRGTTLRLDCWREVKAWLDSPAGADVRTSAALYALAQNEEMPERWDGLA